MGGLHFESDQAGVDCLSGLVGLSQKFFLSRESGAVALALQTFLFDAPSYSGSFKLVFDRVLIEVETKPPGQHARRFLVVLFSTEKEEKEEERLDDPRLWRDVAKGERRRYHVKNARHDSKTMEAIASRRPPGDDQPSVEQISFRLANHECLWLDKKTPADLISAQLVLFFIRWELVKDGPNAWTKLSKTFERVFAKVCRACTTNPRITEELQEGMVTDQMLHSLKNFRFPEGPRAFWAYVEKLMKVALADLAKRQRSEIFCTGQELDEIYYGGQEAVDRMPLPDLCDPETAAGCWRIAKNTAYEWIKRRKWDIQTEQINGRVVIRRDEVYRVRKDISARQELIRSIETERRIKRASALKRLKRGLKKTTSTETPPSRNCPR